jgi:hypothetical protein
VVQQNSKEAKVKQILTVLVCVTILITWNPIAQAQASSLESVWDIFWLEAAVGAGVSLAGALAGVGLGEMGICGNDPLMCAVWGNLLGGITGVAVVGGIYEVKGNLWLAPVLGMVGGFMGLAMDMFFYAISQTEMSFLITTHILTGIFTALGYNLWASL